jgi:hypothetical protein
MSEMQSLITQSSNRSPPPRRERKFARQRWPPVAIFLSPSLLEIGRFRLLAYSGQNDSSPTPQCVSYCAWAFAWVLPWRHCPGSYPGRVDLQLSASARRGQSEDRSNAQSHCSRASRGNGGQGRARPWRARPVQFACGPLWFKTSRRKHCVRLRQLSQDPRPVDWVKWTPQQSSNARRNASWCRECKKLEDCSHLLGDGDRGRASQASQTRGHEAQE